MGAQNVLLTHFSSRYPKVPELCTHCAASGDGVMAIGVAFDLMTVKIGAMRRLNGYLPDIEASFAEKLEEEEIVAPMDDS